MKKIYTLIIALMLVSVPAWADSPDGETDVTVTTGEWDDDGEEDPKINIEFDDVPGSVESVEEIGFRVCVENGHVVAYAGKTMTIPVYDLNGRMLLSLNLSEGRNDLQDLPSGVLIIGNKKACIR